MYPLKYLNKIIQLENEKEEFMAKQIDDPKNSPLHTGGQFEAVVSLQKADNEYQLILVCANCHYKFNYNFPKGHEAKQLGFGDHHFLRKPDSQYDNVECPKCGCTNINKAWEQ